MKNKQKIFVAGHKGMVGSSIIRALQKQGHNSGEIITRTRQQLDLIEQSAVFDFFQQERLLMYTSLPLKSEVYLLTTLIRPNLFMII